ncbi:MAG TPA: phosphoribosyl-ATP diphosphatase [Rhodospirillaceae bacterium]|nr:phosphoribosyl-ATP diphosphatase [Rhodospirillaceae bacterium]
MSYTDAPADAPADALLLDRLFATIAARKGADADTSYTARLFAQGRRKIVQKLGEEAVETVVAALAEGSDRVVGESADLLYHLLVLWADAGVNPAEVWAELQRRQGTSGLEEKKGRAG